MKRFVILITIVITFLGNGFVDRGIWIINSTSQLSIHGSTNVNDFICKIDFYTGTDTLQFEKNYNTNDLYFTRTKMAIPIRSFDCGSKQISKDFWQTLKADVHPQLDINFRSLQNLPLENSGYVNGTVDITLAGVTTRYIIRYEVTFKDRGVILLKGVRDVNFSDFNLEAPQKLNGLIRVKELLKVEFNLVLQQV